MIRLGKLRLQNFKSFLEPITFDFSGTDIVIFDGPNGFGKTTVFDAIELCFTKKVGRIISTDNKQKENHFLKNTLSEDTLVFLELVKNDQTVVVIFIKIPANTTKDDNRIRSFNVERKIISSWPASFENPGDFIIEESVDELSVLLNNNRLSSTFSLFNYVQQEETCHFLKQTEIERHKQINYLFGTKKESDECERFKSIQASISDKIKDVDKDYGKDIGSKDKIKSSLSHVFKRFNNVENIEFSGAIQSIGSLKKESKEQLVIYKNHLKNLSWLLSNLDIYKKQEFNYLVEVMTQEREQELKDLILVGVTKSYKEVLKLDKHISWINTIRDKITSYEDILNTYDKSSQELTINMLRNFGRVFPKYQDDSKEKLNEFRLLTTELGAYEKVLYSLDNSRKSLKKHYELHLVKRTQHKEVECPFCGDLKISNDQLWIEFDMQTKKIEALFNESSIKLKAIENNLFEKFVKRVINRAEYFINKYQEYLELDEVLAKRLITKDRWQNMQRVKKWLDTNIVPYQSVINKNVIQKKENLSQQSISSLKSSIRDLSEPVKSDLNHSTLKSSLSFYGLSYSDEKLLSAEGRTILNSELVHDIDYLSYLDYKSQSSELKQLETSIEEKLLLIKVLNEKLSEIKTIIRIYTKQIKNYEKSVAKQIAIPFYIYSSKILQTRPDGNGVFLQTAENTKENGYIRFVSSLTEEHDAWNTMSSGQLSGLIISFMLAMNKVYPTNLSTLLIDDPVQTMDEINMASFVQLLKYEFPGTQIILSTHERKIANYFSYKYFDSGLDLKMINMKNIKLN